MPVGQASEEGIEGQNKTIRYVREHHTRKVSRVKSNTDLMNWLLQSSSPNIAQYRTRKPDRKRKELLPEAQDLFFSYTYETETSSSDEGEDDSSFLMNVQMTPVLLMNVQMTPVLLMNVQMTKVPPMIMTLVQKRMKFRRNVSGVLRITIVQYTSKIMCIL